MVSAFSFCIYNAYNPLYYTGLLENIELIQKHFPEFYTYVYIGNDVPDSFVIELRVRRHVILRFTHETGPRNMIHRFFAIDEPEVDVMVVRDADSRIHWKDRWAIREFLNTPDAKVHIIRDNLQHTTAIMGGLWGMRTIADMTLRTLYDTHRVSGARGHGMGLDQDFLIDCVYPRVTSVMMIHSSQIWKYRPFEILLPFPFTYTNEIYCGRIEGIPYQEPTAPRTASLTTPLPAHTILHTLPRAMLKLS
jgi:hypothetical protein